MPDLARTARALGQLGLGAALLTAGTGHLTNAREEFRAQVPSWFPADPDAVVLVSGVAELAQAGHTTGASTRNWQSYGAEVRLADGITPWQQALLTDPQTSGGLLVSCDASARDAVLAVFHQHGFNDAGVIGRVEAGSGVTVAL